MRRDWKAWLQALPGVQAETKWDDDWCACLAGRIVAVGGPARGALRKLSFKVDPARFLELTGLPGIRPAPYLARARWIQLERMDALPASELEALLRQAHALTAAKLTRAERQALGLQS